MSSNPGTTLEIGAVLDDKWVILEFVGKGGMGEVYRAHQINLKRDVAIKIVSREWLKSFDCDTEEIRNSAERFRREVHVMAQVHHPHVLQIFDYGSVTLGEEKMTFEYLVMEYVPGSTLRETMSEEGFYPEEDLMKEWLTDYFLPLLDGIHALHELGIVHRDLKPENVLLAGTTPKIADFGLARSWVQKPITRSIDALGTPPYMPPEQFMDLKRTDRQTDVYALGKILYEAVSGKMQPGIPFKQAKLEEPETAFFQELDRIIQEATAEEKKDRLDSADALKQALKSSLERSEESAGEKTTAAAPAASTGKDGGKSARISRKKMFASGLLVLLVFLSAGIGFMVLQKDEPPKIEPPPAAPQQPLTLQGEDGATLHLIPSGEIPLREGFGREKKKMVKMDAFYMDETQVTNQQYVEFLNQNLPDIAVENGVVRGNGNIWLLLGEVLPGYEPIILRDGRFHVKIAHQAACAALRVTGYGASAYAEFYGRRLPTDIEWLYAFEAAKRVPDAAPLQEAAEHEAPQEQFSEKGLGKISPIHTPVMLYEPNAFGVRGLNVNIGEWGLTGEKPLLVQDDIGTEYVIAGGLSADPGRRSNFPAFIPRHPWESFDRVGFRCVLDIERSFE